MPTYGVEHVQGANPAGVLWLCWPMRGLEQGGGPQAVNKAPVGLCLVRGRVPMLIYVVEHN